MTRKFACACVLGIFLSLAAGAQTPTVPPPPATKGAKSAPPAAAQEPPDETDPPEEDEVAKPHTYTYDPLEAQRNIKVGNFYMHRGRGNDYRAAEGRYSDATKYDPKSPEAFFKLGEIEEKLKHKEKAEAAFKKVVELSPDSKLAKEAQKKLSHAG